MTVGDLREAIKTIPDEMELVTELFGNQHDVREIGLAKCGSDGMYSFVEAEMVMVNEANFMISG